MRIFWDERGYTVNEDQLQAEFNDLKQSGNIDADRNFKDYVKECTGKHGTLKEVKNAIQSQNY